MTHKFDYDTKSFDLGILGAVQDIPAGFKNSNKKLSKEGKNLLLENILIGNELFIKTIVIGFYKGSLIFISGKDTVKTIESFVNGEFKMLSDKVEGLNGVKNPGYKDLSSSQQRKLLSIDFRTLFVKIPTEEALKDCIKLISELY